MKNKFFVWFSSLVFILSLQVFSQNLSWSGIGNGPCSSFRKEGEKILYAPPFPKNIKTYNFRAIIKHPGHNKYDYPAVTTVKNLKCEVIIAAFPNSDDDHEVFIALPAGTYILNVGVFHFYLETVKFKVPFKGDLVVNPTWIP
jgi:hypothetical protein